MKLSNIYVTFPRASSVLFCNSLVFLGVLGNAPDVEPGGEGNKASVMTTVTRNQLDGDIKSVVAINMMITVEGGEEGVVILLMRSLLDVIKEGVGILM